MQGDDISGSAADRINALAADDTRPKFRKPRKHRTPEERETIIAMYSTGHTLPEIVETTGIPLSTAFSIIEADKATGAPDNVEAARNKTRADFAEKAGVILEKALLILDRELGRVLSGERECKDLREITTTAGIIYDKRALSRGEATSRVESGETMSDADLIAAIQRVEQGIHLVEDKRKQA